MVCTVDLIHVNVVMIMANKYKKSFNYNKRTNV